MTLTWKKYFKFKKNIPEDKDSVHPETSASPRQENNF